MINVTALTLGPIAVNCYVVTDKDTGRIAVIDPGSFEPILDETLSEAGFDKIDYVLLTHGHYDHIGGVNQVVEKTGGKAKVAIYKTEAPFLSDGNLNLSSRHFANPYPPIRSDILLSDGDKIELGSSVFTVLHTPGHTSGSICFICENSLFTGDTLFFNSVGRTDFPTSNFDHLMGSVRRIAALQGDYIVFPGHNSASTLDYERKHNPFMRN